MPTHFDNKANGLSNTNSQTALDDWNATTADYPRSACLHELVEHQATLTPERIAVEFEEFSISYDELNSRANQLAHALRSFGIGPGFPVAVCMERSPELVATVLAILKAGAAYVPIDPTYPADRVHFMLKQSGAHLIVTKLANVDILPLTGPHHICLDVDWPEIDSESDENLEPLASSSSLAYIIFTSGSTGKPKGVAMPHLPLVNLVCWHLVSPDAPGGGIDVPSAVGDPLYGLRTLQFAPISFDVSAQEIFSTWSSGGSLFLVREELRRDPDALLAYIRDNHIERLFLPVVALIQLAEAVDAGALPPSSVREIITAGEALQITPSVARLFEKLPACTLHNHYGPSETHVVTTHVLSGSPPKWPALPPIGKPISNTQVYVLDADLRRVAVGDEGELYLAGDCLADGYIGSPDLTAEQFVTLDIGSVDSVHLYKTGDRVRFLADGALVYLGRVDQQIKVRGYRIEPGEIEQVLVAQPSIAQAAVVAKDYGGGDIALIGYVVGTELGGLNVDVLRASIAEKLPDYMLPSRLIVVDALPLTPSGKVDRRALSARELSQTVAKSPTRNGFAGDTKSVIEAVWSEALHIDSVPSDQSFFDLGGTSVQMVRVHRSLKDALSLDFTITILFEFPTINKLAIALDTLKSSAQPSLSAHSGGNAGGEGRADRQRDALARIRSLKNGRDD